MGVAWARRRQPNAMCFAWAATFTLYPPRRAPPAACQRPGGCAELQCAARQTHSRVTTFSEAEPQAGAAQAASPPSVVDGGAAQRKAPREEHVRSGGAKRTHSRVTTLSGAEPQAGTAHAASPPHFVDSGAAEREAPREEHVHSGSASEDAGDDDVVVLEDVHLAFDDKRILNGLNLRLRRGQGTAIIGASGTGKSTTLRVICGLAVPQRGRVTVCGWQRTAHISKQPGPVKVSMVFQSGALFDSMTVEENVGFELTEHSRLPAPRVATLVNEALEAVGLAGTNHLYPSELSGGMRRRVAFARAVIHDVNYPRTVPDIVLYDEPSAGLDPIASTRIEDNIRALQRVCATYVVVTHQLSTIRRTADRVVFLHEGRVQWDGGVDDIDTTTNAYVRQFMQASLDGPLFDHPPAPKDVWQ